MGSSASWRRLYITVRDFAGAGHDDCPFLNSLLGQFSSHVAKHVPRLLDAEVLLHSRFKTATLFGVMPAKQARQGLACPFVFPKCGIGSA